MPEETELNIEPSTQHYSASGIESPEQEESYQASEYDSWFNSGDNGEDMELVEAYTLASDNPDLLYQMGLTNELLGTVLALMLICIIFSLMRFIYRLLLDNIFHFL